jgi:hypothetical protein
VDRKIKGVNFQKCDKVMQRYFSKGFVRKATSVETLTILGDFHWPEPLLCQKEWNFSYVRIAEVFL